MALGQVKMTNPKDAITSDELQEEQYEGGNRSGRSTPEWWPQYAHNHATGCGDLSGRSSPAWSPQRGAGYDAPRRPFRVWLLSVIFPNGMQVAVMWNRTDRVSHVKNYIELKTSIPRDLQILHQRGVSTPLVDERLLYDSNVRDEAVINLTFCTTSSF